MIELAILGLLKERPMHGYQLSRELGESLGGMRRVSYGSLYPTLRRLERDGEVEALPQERGGARRRKNVYRITEKGEAEFLSLLQENTGEGSAEDSRFRMRLTFFRYLPPDTRIRLLERRRAILQDRLAVIQDSLRTSRERDADDYALAIMEHSRRGTENDIAWLGDLITAEKDKGSRGEPRSKERRSAALRRKERAS
jgi:DNA-binding PadR family transcriptional regulator